MNSYKYVNKNTMVEAFELKGEVTLESTYGTYRGLRGDYFCINKDGSQFILPKQYFEENYAKAHYDGEYDINIKNSNSYSSGYHYSSNTYKKEDEGELSNELIKSLKDAYKQMESLSQTEEDLW